MSVDRLSNSSFSSTPLVAVANNRLHVGRGQAHELWDPQPGYPPPFRIFPLVAGLERDYLTDAHLVTYVVHERGKPVEHQPRLVKAELQLVRDRGYEVVHYCHVADIDTKPHGRITPAQIEDARQRLAPLIGIGWYTSKNGLRVIQPRLTPCSPEQWEAATTPWLEELQAIMGDAWLVDPKCKDWTRHFRCPRVQRDDEPTAKTLVIDLGRMTAREFAHVDEPPPPPPPVPYVPPKGVKTTDIRDRARMYVATFERPTCGQSKCRDFMWDVALHVVKGFALGNSTDAVNIVRDTCGTAHSWGTREAENTVESAFHTGRMEMGLHLKEEPPCPTDGPFIVEDMVLKPKPLPIVESTKPTPEAVDIPDAMLEAAAAHVAPTPKAKKAPKAKRDGTWRDSLLLTKREKTPKGNASNVECFLTKHPEWMGQCIALDEFNDAVVWLKDAPPSWVANYPEAKSTKRGTPWSEDDTTRLIATLNREGIDTGRDVARTMIDAVASTARFHPVREELLACRAKWDGTHRLGVVPDGSDKTATCWLASYCGAEDNEHTRKAGAWWLVQAVRRIFKPGALAKYVLTLEGAQDIGKSSTFRILGGAYFSDTIHEPGSLNAMLALSGVWIQEIPEGALLTRTSMNEVKTEVGKVSDHYVRKFQNISVTKPRQVVYGMTTNDESYINDPTGAVRWWAVKMTQLDFAKLEADRDQLLGEAVALFQAGVIPEPRTAEEKALFGEAAEERQTTDVWEAKVMTWIGTKTEITVEEILTDCIEVKVSSQEQKDKNRVVAILKKNGWPLVRRAFRVDADGRRHRPKVYSRITDPASAPPQTRQLTLAEVSAWRNLQIAGWKEAVNPDGRRTWIEPSKDQIADAELANVLGL